jgi:hypothetical protein
MLGGRQDFTVSFMTGLQRRRYTFALVHMNLDIPPSRAIEKRLFLKSRECSMVVGPLPATALNTLVSTPHGLRANPVLSKVDATSSIGDVSKPEEIHFPGTTGDMSPAIPAGGTTHGVAFGYRSPSWHSMYQKRTPHCDVAFGSHSPTLDMWYPACSQKNPQKHRMPSERQTFLCR